MASCKSSSRTSRTQQHSETTATASASEECRRMEDEWREDAAWEETTTEEESMTIANGDTVRIVNRTLKRTASGSTRHNAHQEEQGLVESSINNTEADRAEEREQVRAADSRRRGAGWWKYALGCAACIIVTIKMRKHGFTKCKN